MKELFNDPKQEEYLSEFKQKIAQEMQEDIERRKRDLEHSRNGFIGALAGIILAFLVSWFLLLPRFGFQDNKEIPVIRRPILPVKIQPNDPGGMEIQNQDKTVYALVEKNELKDTVVESLLPEPEQPKLPVLAPNGNTIVQAFDTSMNAELLRAINTSATESLNIPPKLPVIDVQPLKTNEPLTIKEQKSDKEAPEKNEKPVKEEIKKEQVAAIKPVEEAKKPAPQQQNTQPVVAPTGSWCVQMMASNNKDALEQAYSKLQKQYPVISPLPYKIEDNADGLYRLKVGTFKTKDEADALCIKIKTAGGNCLVKEK